MCGIAGIYQHRPILSPAQLYKCEQALLLAIDHRGGDATGRLVVRDGGGVDVEKGSCRARVFLAEGRPVPTDTVAALWHTRYATQGSPAFGRNNHPVRHGDVYVTHNGHVENDREILGLRRRADVDSEAIAAALHDGWDAVPAALERVNGSMAVAAVHREDTARVLLARGRSSPLHWVTSKRGDVTLWASTVDALQRAWGATFGGKCPTVWIAPEGWAAWLSPNGLETFGFNPPAYSWSRGTLLALGEPAKTPKTPKTVDEWTGPLARLDEAELDVDRCPICSDWTDVLLVVGEAGEAYGLLADDVACESCMVDIEAEWEWIQSPRYRRLSERITL